MEFAESVKSTESTESTKSTDLYTSSTESEDLTESAESTESNRSILRFSFAAFRLCVRQLASRKAELKDFAYISLQAPTVFNTLE